ncbi:MAG: TlpA disulfide reductase family protein [Terracidiphilus sp.]
MKRNTLVTFAVLLLLAAFAWAGWANWENRRQAAEKRAAMAAAKVELLPAAAGDIPGAASPLVDKPAPAFTLEDLSGKKISLESFKGKAVLINFWATWCGPCKLETPWLVQLRDQYAAKGFEVIGISTEGEDLSTGDKAGWARQKADIAKFVKAEKMDYPVLINGDSLAKPYGGLDAMPTSFYVDRNGKVVASQMGITSKEDMENNIRKALGEGM